jgi:superfamily II DNA or RNA helicase
MHPVGTWVWSKKHVEPVQIVDTQVLWKHNVYRVWVPSKDEVRGAKGDELSSLAEAALFTKERLTYVVAAGKVADSLGQEMLVAPLSGSLIPLPHQLYVLSRAVSSDKVRYLLADEVGLGKTIEAGLIMRELKMRGHVRRVLVAVPKGLVDQWVQEMWNHFKEDFKVILPESASRMLGEDGNLWELFDQVVVPIDSVKPMKGRRGWSAMDVARYNRERYQNLVSAGWDLIIVDEAHKLAGSSSSVARHKLGKGLAKAAPNLLLLSATPHQGKTDAFLRLLRILDSKAFLDEKSIEREKVRRYVIRTEKRRAIDAEGRPLFKPRHTTVVPVVWGEKHAKQKELYERVTEYVRHGYNRAIEEKKTYIGFLMVLMQRLVSSSTSAIRVALEKRLDVLERGEYLYSRATPLDEEWWELDVEERMEEILTRVIPAFKEERDEVMKLLSLARQCGTRGPDARAEALLDIMYQLQREESNPDLKFLVFTEFLPTQEMLRDFLQSRGFPVVCLNGSMGREERRNAQKRFADEAKVMVSTEAGGEGLNLQFCHVVINYDLPWNPMRLEQRIGRVDRIGQEHLVKAFNFVFDNTVEQRVHEILEEKLAIILQDLGFDKVGDILDSAEAEKSFEGLYVDAIMDPEMAEEKLHDFLDSFRQRTREEREGLKLMEYEDELSPAMAREVNGHPLPRWTEKMVLNYLCSAGGKVGKGLRGYNLVWPDGYSVQDVVFSREEAEKSGAEHITLSDVRIQEIVNSIPRYVSGQPVQKLIVKGLPGEIKGYWSLWQVAVRNDDGKKTRVFPMFLHIDGRMLLPTAKRIWGILMRENFELVGVAQENDAPYKNSEEKAKKIGYDILHEIMEKDAFPEFFSISFVYVEGSDD